MNDLALVRVAKAAEEFVAKVKECDKALAPIYQMAAIHGTRYEGPTYNPELEALEQALAEARKETV